MVKILKKSKKPISTHPKVNAVILAIQDAPDHDLPGILNAVSYWHWPRTDLHYWIKALNRFDSILEEICKSYNVREDHIQVNEFTPRTKELILSIIRFSRLLLENATNRKLYSSFDRMNDLLLTQDPDILEAALRLIFRRAQQVAANGAPIPSGETFSLTPRRVANLTFGWKPVRQAGLSMFDLVSEEVSPSAISAIARVDFQFYRKASASSSAAANAATKESEAAGDAIAMTPAATPAPKSAMKSSRPTPGGPSTPSAAQGQSSSKGQIDPLEQEGMTTINLGNVNESGKAATDVLMDAMELYRVPQEEKLRLLQRIRVGMAIRDANKRRQMLRIRLLAIGVLIHTHPDNVAESEIFLHEPDFITQLAELVQPNKPVPMDVRTVALLALDTCCRVDNRVNDVTAALSVSVNHGTLMSILRKLSADLHSDHPETTAEYVDALFSFLTFLQTAHYAGNMLHGAGAIPLLVDLVKETKLTHDALLVANRAVTFLDNFTYSFPNASGPFATAGGLQVFVERVRQLVAAGVAVSSDNKTMDTEDVNPLMQLNDPNVLSYGESTLLKSLFRCLQRLMNSGQNTEGVRQLIDSSLVESCKLVMKHRHAFGPQNFALAVTIMLTFVHNEPTSLTVLQESKVPDVFYEAIRGDIEPSLDVLSVIPTAIGALCLNEAGLNQFESQCADILDKFFTTFLSEKHARILNERENAVIIGANFDELVRHHPSLKQPVLEAITSLLKKIYEEGKDYAPDTAEGYRLQLVSDDKPATSGRASNYQAGEEQGSSASDVNMSEQAAGNEAAGIETADLDHKRDDNRLLASVAVTGRFLEGFFTTPSHCKDYIKKDGLDHLLRLFTLPCIPFDVHHHAPFPGLTTVFLTISEHSPDQLLRALMNQAKEALTDLTDFWQPEDISQQPIDTAKLERTVEDMLQPRSSEALDRANKTFRSLVKAQHVLTIMSELHSTDAYVTRQPSSQILSLLRNPERTQTIQELCGLLRACTFAAVKLKGISPNSGSASLASSLQSTASQGASQPTPGATSNENNGADVAMSTAGANSAVVDDGKAAAWPATTSANAKALKMVLLAIPDSLKSFLQGIMGLHATRRSSVDNQQRKDATFVAHAISLGVAQNLRWPDSPNNSANFEYATLMIKFLVDLLQVERSTTGGLHLIFLKALDKQEGTDRLLSLHARYVEEVAELSRIPESERDSPSRLRLIHAVGGLKVILNVFETLTSHRFLLSAGHLLLLTQDRSSQSFFDPYAFLVKLRCRILPAVASTWNADFLAQSPPIIVRAVFRILLQILEGQGESGEGDAAASFTSVLPTRPQVVASPTLVQSLVEMGFPRAACEQALVRRNNNLATAADYLMSHPEIVAAARAREEQDAGNGQQEPEAVDNPSQAEAAASESESRLSPADVDMTDAPSGRGTPLPPPVADEAESGNVSAQLQGSSKTKPAKKYTRAELDAHRDQVKETFISRALALAQDHGELVFDIRQALKTIDLKLPGQEPYDTSRGLNAILQDLTSRLATGPPSTPEEDRSTTARVRLVALIFSDPAFRRAVDTSYIKAMEPVMRLVEDYNRQKYSVESRPKWLSSILLLSELILARAELPKDAEASSGEVTNPSEILRGPAFEVEREALFNLSLDVLQKTVSDRDLLQSTLRVVLMLTRQTATAQKFIEQGGLQALMQNYARGRRDTEGFQEFAIMILRHTVEDRVAVKAVMENHIQAWLSKARKAVVTDSYVKDLNADACRDVPTFLDLTADLCRLISVSGGYGVTTKQEKIESSSADAPPVVDGDETLKIDKHDASMHIDDLTKALPSSTPASPAAENVMHFLITEAVAATQAALKAPSNLPDVSTVEKTSPSATSSNLPSEATGTDTSAPSHAEDANVPVPNATSSVSSEPVEQPVSQSIKDFTYASFLLTCISELAASYTTCKASLISWSKRKTDGAAPSSKSGRWKSSFLYHLLAHVIPTASPNLGKDLQSRKRFALSTKAINVIISVCHDNSRNPFDPKSVISSEITNLRKTVLDGIAKAFKEAESTQEDVDARYGRLSALSVLCSRLLAPPATVSGQPSAAGAQNDMAMQMAKIMLEKNYASLLTSALGDIDFNHPDALILIEAILLPLENLTNLVTKLGRNTQAEITRTDSATPVQPAVVASESLSSEDEDADSEDMEIEDEGDLENEEDEDDRAASDVYRNSALGMFQGELEPANAEEQYSSDDAMEEDMQEWDDEEDEMMEDEGAVPSDISDESEGEEDMMDLAHEVEEELDAEDEDEDGSSQDEDDEDEEGEHDEDEDDEHDDDLEELDDGPAIDMQADIAAALRNGHLEPVDDFTSRLINEQMNMFGEPADGGMIQAHFGDNNQLQDDDNDNLEEGDAPDDEDDESDGDDDDGDDVNDRVVHGGNVAEIFDNLLGGHGGAGLDESNVHVSVVGGPSGGERILSIDIGGPPPPAFARRSAPRSNQARHLGQHSLLTDNTEAGRRGGRGDFMGGSRHRHRAGREGADFNDWVQSLEDMIGNGAGQLLEQVFGNMPAMNASTGPLAAIANRPPTDTRNPVDLLQNLISGLNRGTAGSRHRHIHQADHRPASANIEMQLVTEAINNTLPNPPTTTDRWSDESAIFSGGLQASERISIIAKRVNAILLPEKQRRDQEQREKDAKEREERDREIREREEKEAAEAVRKAAEEQTAINQSRDAEMSTNTAGEQTEAVQAPVQAPQGSEFPQTPVNAGAATGERLSWRERIERRRQAQAAQGSDHQGIVGAADGTPSVPQGSSLRDSLLDRANGGDLAEVLDLAARLSAAGPASPSNLQGGENHSTAPVNAAPDVHMDREESAVAADEPTVGDTTEQIGEESQASAPLAGPSTAPERITIQVRGNTIDITDTGIDPTFLEALPDDMREEVLNQHFRETRAAAAPTTQSAPTSINAEFLDALPPELRAEVLAQEALEAARVRAAAAAAAAPAPQATTEAGAGAHQEGAAPPVAAEPAEMDPVAFLASLDPHLRQTVLMEQGEDMLTALPPDMLEEYRALRDQEIREHGGFRRHLPRRTDLNQFRTGAGAVASRKAVPTIKRDAVQLLDKTGVAALVRLLFFPSHAKKNTLASILKHLCENSKTRIEIINLLLTVLHEGTRETGSGGETVDKTISALTSSSQVPLSANKNAKTGGKGKGPAPPSTPGFNAGAPASSHIAGLPHHLIASGPGENIPTIAVQKSLETLAHLVNSNESSAAFFLSEQELPLNLTGNKRPPQSSKRDKGKGRPSEVALSKEKVYPIIVLFSLMDRKTLTDSPVIMEALTKLLASITVPLRHLDLTGALDKATVGDTSNAPSSSTAGGSAAVDTPAISSTNPATPAAQVPAAESTSLTKPPQLPAAYLKMVVHVLDLGECSSKMFSAALMLIHHLWLLPDARATISTELIALAQKYGSQLLTELAELKKSLAVKSSQAAGQEAEAEVLRRFSQASSSQTKLLRVLKTIEYAKQQQARAIKRRRILAEKRKEEVESKKGDVPSEYEEILKEKEKASSTEADTAMETEDKEKAKAEAIKANYERQLAKVEAELKRLKSEEEAEQHKVEELYDGFDFSPVWTKLSDCLTVMEEESDVGSSAGTLLPLIEAFLMVSSWGLEGVDINALYHDTPAMLPTNQARASLSPMAQPVSI